jgi:hypothetical protein
MPPSTILSVATTSTDGYDSNLPHLALQSTIEPLYEVDTLSDNLLASANLAALLALPANEIRSSI